MRNHPNTARVSINDLLVTVGVVLVAVAGLLVPTPFDGPASSALGDMVHAPMFAGLTCAAFIAWRRFSGQPPGSPLSGKAILIVVGSLFVFGVATELIQGWSGRSGNVKDTVADMLGIAAGAIWFKGRSPGGSPVQRTHGRKILASVVAAVLVLISWVVPSYELLHLTRVYLRFPQLTSFESWQDLERWYWHDSSGRRSTRDATDGSYSLEIRFEPKPDPDATMADFRSDWSEVASLELDVAVDPEEAPATIDFMVKVIDHDHKNYDSDTFRLPMTLGRGERRHVSISREKLLQGPDERPLNLSSIRFISFQVLDAPVPVIVRVDDIRLRLLP